MTRWIAVGTAALIAACMNSDRDANRTASEQVGRESALLANNFELIGHNPLFNRGMNAALAIFDHFVYIGNRSDGSNSCGDL